MSDYSLSDMLEMSNESRKRYDQLTEEQRSANFLCEYYEDGVSITRYIGYEKYIIIPETINGFTVRSIGEECFFNFDIFSVELPTSLKKIQAKAFAQNPNFLLYKIPESVTEIGEEAFSGTGLVTLELPTGIKTIGEKAFFNCPYLSNIIIDKKNKNYKFSEGILLHKIDKDSFQIHTYLSTNEAKDYTVPDTIGTILAGAFSYNNNIETIDAKSVNHFRDYAFYGCENLNTLEIKGGMVFLGKNLFSNSRKTLIKLENLGSFGKTLLETMKANNYAYKYTNKNPIVEGINGFINVIKKSITRK